MGSTAFLWCYAALIVGGIAVARSLVRPAEPGAPPVADAWSAAWLAGGAAAVLRLAAFELIELGALRVEEEVLVRQPAAEPASGLPALLLARLPHRTPPAELTVLDQRFPDLAKAIEDLAGPWQASGHATPPGESRRAARCAWILGTAILLVGGARAVTGSGDAGFTIIAGLFGTAAVAIAVPPRRLTPAGERVLAGLRQTCAGSPGAPFCRGLAQASADDRP